MPVANYQFKILGPMEISRAGESISVSSPKLRILLTALLLNSGTVVSVDDLTDYLWNESQPTNPRAALQTLIRRLRILLGNDELIKNFGSGYRIQIDGDQLDLIRFRNLVKLADQAGDADTRAQLLSDALGIWRGPALSDIQSDSLRRHALVALTEERISTLELHFETNLHLGRHARLVTELRAAAVANPYRERLWGQLMLALYGSGRQAEALEVYQQIRYQLVDELGMEPGEELRNLHESILKSDVSLWVSDGQQPGTKQTLSVPAQLPPQAVGFVGRQDLVDHLSNALLPTVTRTGTPVVVLSGLPGVGKTALAVHIGQRVRSSFPDGQLYVNLRGYESPGQSASLRPEQVLPQFLRSIGVPANQIPTNLTEQVNVFRSRLSGTNTLVVLDNAASIEQVMPLIPGDAGCSVLITSRSQLHGLASGLGARVISIGTLSPDESITLIESMHANAQRTVEPNVMSEVTQLCAHLPLALRIAAANLITAPGGNVEHYLNDLRHGNRLAALSIEGDTTSAVSTAIALSYSATEPDEQHVFRFAGLFPGTEFSANAVAVLADISTAQARTTLNRLKAMNLLQQQTPGRYQFHDLLKEFARDRSAQQDTAQDRAAAIERLGHWYLICVRGAVDVLHSEFVRLEAPAGLGALEAAHFTDESQAMAWLLAERHNLATLIPFFASKGPQHLSWHMADALRGFFWTGNYRTEWREAAQSGLAAATKLGDKHGIASMHRSLANLSNTLGDYHEAIAHHRQSLAMHRELDMPEETAATLNNLGLAQLSLGRVDDAEDSAQEALSISRRVTSQRLAASTLGLLGSIQWTRGDIAHATTTIAESVLIADRIGLHHIISYSLRNLGLVHQATGDLSAARGCFDRAIEVSDRIDSLHDKSIALYGLALVDYDLGSHEAALRSATQALGAFVECGDRTYEIETLCLMSLITESLHDWDDSVRYAALALDLARKIQYTDGEAHARARLAVTDSIFCKADSAIGHADAALAIIDRSANQITVCKVLSQLGPLFFSLEQLDRAEQCALRMLHVSVSSGQRLGVARANRILGSVAAAENDIARAMKHWKHALQVFSDLGIPDAATVRASIDSIDNNDLDRSG